MEYTEGKDSFLLQEAGMYRWACESSPEALGEYLQAVWLDLLVTYPEVQARLDVYATRPYLHVEMERKALRVRVTERQLASIDNVTFRSSTGLCMRSII